MKGEEAYQLVPGFKGSSIEIFPPLLKTSGGTWNISLLLPDLLSFDKTMIWRKLFLGLGRTCGGHSQQWIGLPVDWLHLSLILHFGTETKGFIFFSLEL